MMKRRNMVIAISVAVFFLSACEAQSGTTTITATEITSETNESANETVETTAEFIQPIVEKINVTIGEHEYEYDTVTSATKEEKVDVNTKLLSAQEKEAAMYWSGRPQSGVIKGDYYVSETLFNEGYTALIEVVKDGDQIVQVELNEIGPGDYYDENWAGASKRLSGYAFFQADKQRTDSTLVTWVNGMTYLEYQMVNENRLSGEFRTLKGSSNSARQGFLPAAAQLAEQLKEPSGRYYYSITKDLGDGMSARLKVIFDDRMITAVNYDEYFADTKEEISDETMKQFYRQSKYFSATYQTETNIDFRAFADTIETNVIKSQDLLIYFEDNDHLSELTNEKENYLLLAAELMDIIN